MHFITPCVCQVRGTPFTAQHRHVFIENTEIIILLTTSHARKNTTKLNFLRLKKKRPWWYYLVCYFSGHAMGWHHLQSGLQELWLLLNDNYHGSWGASIFYNLVVVSTFLCKGSWDRHTHTHTHTDTHTHTHTHTQTHTHTHTQVESGGRAAHTDLILSDKTLWGVQRERGRWRGREGGRERDMGERGVRETLQGPLLPSTAIKWKQELSVCPPKPCLHESGREAH